MVTIKTGQRMGVGLMNQDVGVGGSVSGSRNSMCRSAEEKGGADLALLGPS